jgi:hypothetical protein
MRVLIFIFCLITGLSDVNAQLYINEFLSSNINGILDEDNEYSDWIEIYNAGSNSVSLSGYALTDNINTPLKWVFPDIALSANDYLLVFASGKDRYELPLTYQTLIDMGDTWRYLVPSSDIGTSWLYVDFDDSGWASGKSGFGYSDNDDSTIVPDATISIFIRKEFSITDLASVQRLVLSIDYDDGFVAYVNGHEIARANLGTTGEIIPFDRTTDIDHEAVMYSGGSPSYYYIDNPGSILVEGTNIIAIQGHNISTTSSDLTLIPFLTIGRTGGSVPDVSPYLTFPARGELHTNFKINAEGESLYLFNASAQLVDSVGAIYLLNDVSYGRKPDGSADWRFFGEPTPGSTNSTIGAEEVMANPVIFSPLGGKHLGGMNVSLSTANPSDTIYYTTDGSIPEKTDFRYTDPVYISNSEVVHARVIKYNTLPGPVGSNTYVTGLDHDIPIVCLSTEPANLWDEMTGIYAYGPNPGDYPYFGANFWQDWERPVHIELYDVQGSKKIDQDAGIKIYGAWSRACDQKSVALYARKEYGKGSFEYRFFADKPIDKFESIVLRNSGNDNMGLQFHDCFMTGLTRNMDIDRMAFQPAAIYLNGEYWGLLNIREKVNENFIAENHCVDPDSVNLLQLGGEIINGTNEDYLSLINYLNINTTLQNNDKYYWVRDKISVNNYIQYMLTEIYINNRDWPGNNIKYWNTTSPESKWRWIIFDTDFGFGIWDVNDYKLNTLDFALETNGPDWPNPPWSTLLLRRLVSNMEFRNNFIIQFCDRLNFDFLPSRVISDLDSLRNLYDQEIVYNFNRWWGTYEEWLGRIADHKTFGQYRPEYCRQHMQQKFSLGDELNVTVNVSDENAGRIKLNTITPGDYPFTGIYFENIPIKFTAIPKPGYKFVRWEGTISSTGITIDYNMSATGSFKAVFAEADASDISIVINEINYNSSPDRDTKDWVEIMNNGVATVDLKDWLFSDSGPDSGFFFPSGITLAPQEYLVICRNLKKFRDFNPDVNNAIGELPFGLSSNGDNLRLYDPESHVMDAVDYYPYHPWPENADGTGATIELIDPSLDNAKGENWQAVGIGGTPGRPNYGYLDIQSPSLPNALTSAFECFPNPFRDYTTVQFTVISGGYYKLEILDIDGRVVDILSDGYLSEGTYWVDWNGTSASNERLQGGVFIVRLSDNNTTETKKIILIQ